mmetsp:Transcript_40638/g.67951  ORF Transcript_40638/g.67951 Transcript_40638/m.67951 type:complete len:385 (+) Transcript_40638:962-2116(+)
MASPIYTSRRPPLMTKVVRSRPGPDRTGGVPPLMPRSGVAAVSAASAEHPQSEALGLVNAGGHARGFVVHQLVTVQVVDHHIPLLYRHHCGALGLQLALQDTLRQHVLQHRVHHAPQGPGAVGGVVAAAHHQVLELRRDLQLDFLLGKLLDDVAQHDLCNLVYLGLSQLVEHDDVVQPIQELGLEEPLQLFVNRCLDSVVLVRDVRAGLPVGVHSNVVIRASPAQQRGLASLRIVHLVAALGHVGAGLHLRTGRGFGDVAVLGNDLTANVAGHDEKRVLEIYGAPLAIRQAPILQDLQHDVEDLWVGLLNLIEQHHGVGLASHRFSQLAPLIIAHISRRGPDQFGHGVALHVLTHVKAHHRFLRPKVCCCKCLRKLGLPDTRRA